MAFEKFNNVAARPGLSTSRRETGFGKTPHSCVVIQRYFFAVCPNSAPPHFAFVKPKAGYTPDYVYKTKFDQPAPKPLFFQCAFIRFQIRVRAFVP